MEICPVESACECVYVCVHTFVLPCVRVCVCVSMRMLEYTLISACGLRVCVRACVCVLVLVCECVCENMLLC